MWRLNERVVLHFRWADIPGGNSGLIGPVALSPDAGQVWKDPSR